MEEFRLNKVSAGNKVGRPEDSGMMEAFENICEWLENSADCELYTVSDLHEKMTQANDGPVYTIMFTLLKVLGAVILYALRIFLTTLLGK